MAKKPETKTQQQARARIMWENDKFSQRIIAEKIGVSERTIANWSERGMPNPLRGPWVKGSLAEKVHEMKESSILQIANEMGMDSAFFLSKVKQLCTATRPVLVKGDDEGQAKDEGDESGGGFVQEIPDYKAIDAGLTHAERIIPGLKAAEKVQIDFPSKMLAFFQGDA